MSRRILQSILAVIGLIAVITGALGLLAGITADYGDYYRVSVNPSLEGNIVLDSNLRYFSGLWLGLGLILFWIIPSIERQKTVFRLLSGMIFIGGLGRLISMAVFGMRSPVFAMFVVLEVLFPLLILWQNQIPQSQLLSKEKKHG
ncbi:MAG: DUF4345 domain-containing protein [Anaerolineales bacterium]